MKRCDDCKFADWKRTKDGRLHPSKEGRCTYEYSVAQLPQAFYWIGTPPTPSGGYIARGKDLQDHCAYWQREERK